MKKILTGLVLVALVTVVGVYLYQHRGAVKLTAVQPPEEVVSRFYAYVGEGGSSSLSEAYRLISTKHYTLAEDKFKGIVLNYPKDLKVKVLGSKITEESAVVTIEYKTQSSFGGEFVSTTEINLDYDRQSQSWKIDFTGETATTDTDNVS